MPDKADTLNYPDGCGVIFGGTGGTGGATAKLLALRGMNVVVTYHNRRESAEAVLQDLSTASGAALLDRCDVASRQSVAAVLKKASAQFGRISTIICATGIMYDVNEVADIDPERFHEIMATDVYGFFNILQESIPYLRKGGGGSITTVVTTSIHRFLPKGMLSSAPKAAVWMMVRHAAAEEAKNGIRVNAVGPGVIGDFGMAVAMSGNTGREQNSFNRSVSKIPMGRMGKAQELAEVVTFLASNNASYVTGVLVPCDGGLALS